MLIVGDSVLSGKDERRITQSKVKLRCFPGVTTQDMEDHLKSLLKSTRSIILHIGTNSTPNKPSIILLDGILSGKQFKSLSHCQVVIFLTLL